MTEIRHRTGETPEACPAFVGLLVRAADETLEEADRARLDAHLAGCAACRAALANQRAARAVLLDLEPTDASPAFASRVMAALDAHEGNWLDARDFRRDAWRAAPVAAALLLAAYLVSGQVSATGGGTQTTAPGTEPAQVSPTIRWSEAVSESDPLALMETAGASDEPAASVDTPKESPQ